MSTVLLVDYKSQNLKGIIDKVLNQIIVQLAGFDKLQIRLYPRTNEDLERQRQRELKFKSLINDWKNEKGLKFEADISCDVGGIAQGPCHIWFKNILLAFQDVKVKRVIYLPYDIKYMLPKAVPGKRDKRLQGFINTANKGNFDLLLGTYECSTDVSRADDNNFLIDKALTRKGNGKDIPKNSLEDFTILELQRNFPSCMDWFRKRRTDPRHKPKPRTGFFSLSRRFYKQFVEDRRIMKPWAGTVQLLICAAMQTLSRKKRFRVAEQFVAELEEPQTSWGGYGLSHQRLRIEFVIADEREYWSRTLPRVPL